MKAHHKLLWWLALIPFVVLVSCKDEDDPLPADDFATLTEYLETSNLDLDNILADWIVGAPAEADVNTFTSAYYILDIRSAADFAGGHLTGAVNSSYSTILSDAASADKPILVVCYTGQTAGHAVVALRLSGYPDAKVLKFGMSGWNSNFSTPWASNSGVNGDVAVGHNMWKSGQLAQNQTFSFPSFTATAGTAQEILQERVNAMLQEGFKGVSCSDVLANPNGYFINNYWAATDTEHYGHIENAHRIMPLTITGNEIANLDPDQTIVTYCWTGQTSSMITAYLTVLGYDALSLKFGANGMIYSELESHKFVSPVVDLPVVTE